MDPITHGAIGLLIGTLGGGDITLANGAMLASIVGAVAPDLDIVAQLKGDYAYLKQHRLFSHSIVGLGLISLVTAFVLSFIFPELGIVKLALWAMAGALSHSFIDLFNSYGVGAIYPFRRRRYTFNLLPSFDPVFLGLISLMIYNRHSALWSSLTFIAAAGYMLIRYAMKRRTYSMVVKQIPEALTAGSVIILPAVNNFFSWEFIVLGPERKIVGKVGLLPSRLSVKRVWEVAELPPELEAAVADSVLSQIFREFTPLMHVEYEQEGELIIGRFMDLRYFVKGRFLHNGTIVINSDYQVKEAIFQPYSLKRRTILET